MTVKPIRVQRSRKKGWRIPENTVYVGRPTIWGNPFQIGERTHAEVVRLFRAWLNGHKFTGEAGGLRRLTVLARVHELQGKNLACWCGLSCACHADVLLELANTGGAVAAKRKAVAL